jgi:PDZ domain
VPQAGERGQGEHDDREPAEAVAPVFRRADRELRGQDERRGGALVDLAGQVMGIPTLAAVDQQLGGSAAPGIGFVISSNMVTNIARQLIATGHVTSSGRAALGVEVATATGANGAAAGVGVVSVTPGGPAAKAGIRSGDIITAVNGTATPDVQTLTALLANAHPGQRSRSTSPIPTAARPPSWLRSDSYRTRCGIAPRPFAAFIVGGTRRCHRTELPGDLVT